MPYSKHKIFKACLAIFQYYEWIDENDTWLLTNQCLNDSIIIPYHWICQTEMIAQSYTLFLYATLL